MSQCDVQCAACDSGVEDLFARRNWFHCPSFVCRSGFSKTCVERKNHKIALQRSPTLKKRLSDLFVQSWDRLWSLVIPFDHCLGPLLSQQLLCAWSGYVSWPCGMSLFLRVTLRPKCCSQFHAWSRRRIAQL